VDETMMQRGREEGKKGDRRRVYMDEGERKES
jgi:hypothetical protein